MHEKSDAQLLSDYAQHGDETAFAELVSRHTNLVYSAVWRQVGSPEIAAEVTQSVFIGLARGSRSLSPRLSEDASLARWLCRSARNISLNLRRDEFRRHSRERQAMEHFDSTPETVPNWERLCPVLDAAMSELDETDYDALVMRFFKNQDLQSVGLALGVSDDCAQKRVSRALEKLREHLSRRGITTSAAALSIVLSANAIQVAPVGLAVTISTAAALAGTAVQASTAFVAAKTIAMTTIQKTLIGAALAVAVGTGIFEARQASKLQNQVQTLLQQQAPLNEENQHLQRERNESARQLAALREDNERLNRNTAELLKLRGQAGALRQELAALKRHMVQPDSQSNDSGKTWVIGDIKWKPEWKDLGLSSPDAAVQTYWWAVANTNAERIKQCMVFDRLTNAVPVSDLFAKRESRANQGFYQSGWAARLAAVTQDSPYRARLQIEWMAQVPAETAPSFNPAEPPKWSPERTETLEVMRNEPDGEWKIIGNEGRVMLTLDDEDSEAVAKMLMQMPPEQVEELKSKIPEPTLRVYEEMKTRGVK